MTSPSRNSRQRIANLPTKDHWRDPSRLEWIEQGLIKLRQYMEARGCRTVAIPKLGCGEGGLDWVNVKELIVMEFENSDLIAVIED